MTLSVADVSPLSSLTGLSELSLNYNLVTNVSPLSSLDQLEFLGLAYNEITTGVTTLVTLTSAWQIDFSGNYEIPEADLDVLEGALGPGVVLRP